MLYALKKIKNFSRIINYDFDKHNLVMLFLLMCKFVAT